jgi:hypothetical protein
VLSLVIGFIAIGMGVKAMTPAGIPLTRQKQLHGFWAKVAGGFCLLVGLLMLADGAWSLVRVGRQVADLAGVANPPAGAVQAGPSVDLLNAARRRPAFTAQHGDFAILFPSTPTEIDKRPTATDEIAEQYAYVSQIDETVARVDYTRFVGPLNVPIEWFESIRDKLLVERNTTLAFERREPVLRNEAYEFCTDEHNGKVLRVKFIVDGSRLYRISMSGPPGSESSPEIDEFFHSFELLPRDDDDGTAP